MESRTLLSGVVANGDAFTTFSNTPFTFGPSDLLSNDTGAALMTSIGNPQTGTLTPTSTGGLQYIPQGDGTDTLNYTVQGSGTGGGLLLEVRTATQDSFIPLDSLHWEVDPPNSGSTTPAVRDFTLTAPADRWSPGLFAAAAGNGSVTRAVITHRSSTGAIDELWTLRNAFFTAYGTNTSGGRPEESFSLSASQVDFSRMNYDAAGNALAPTTAGWDLNAQSATQTAPFAFANAPSGSPAVLRIGKDIAWPVNSNLWIPDPTTQTLGRFTFTSSGGSESPALLSAALNQTSIPDLTLSASTGDGTLDWHLQNVLVTTYSVDGRGPGAASDRFTLSASGVTETFTNGADSRSATFQLPLTKVASAADFGNEKASGAGLWADFVSNTGTPLGSIPLQNVQWGEAAPPSNFIAGRPTFPDLVLHTNVGLHSPGVAQDLFAGAAIPEVIIRRVDSGLNVTQEWTLHSVLISSSITSTGPGSESFRLRPGRIDFTNAVNGAATTIGYDILNEKLNSSVSFGGSDLSAAPDGLIVHMASGGDIAATAVNWGTARDSTSRALSFNEFSVAVGSAAQATALVSASIHGTLLPLVTVTQRESGVRLAEWDLQNVLVTSYSGSSFAGDLAEQFTLAPQAVTETFGSSKASWNLGTNSGSWTRGFGGQALTPPPPLMLDLMDESGNSLGQVPLDSFLWDDATDPSGFQLGAVTFHAQMNAASSGMLAALFNGLAPPIAVITRRDGAGTVISQWSFDGPSFLSYSVGSDGTHNPSETFSFNYTGVHLSTAPFDPVNPPTTNAFGYDVGRGAVTAQADLANLDASGPLVLEFPNKSGLALSNWQWGERHASGTSGPSSRDPLTFSPFSATTDLGPQAAALATAVARKTVFDHVLLKRNDSSGNLLQEWDLGNVTITAYWANGGNLTATVLLSATVVTEIVYVANLDGTFTPYSATSDLTTGGTTTPDFGRFIPTDGSVAIGTVTIHVVPPATITGLLFNDQNYNGVRDASDAPLSGWTVYLDANNNGVLDPGEVQATTPADGSFGFGPLLGGAYVVREVVPAGWARTAPTTDADTLALAAGQSAAAPVFGNVRIDTITLNFNYLLIMAQHYGQSGTAATGDLTGDNTVNFNDLLLLAQNYGHTLPAPAAAVFSPLAAITDPPMTRRRKGLAAH